MFPLTTSRPLRILLMVLLLLFICILGFLHNAYLLLWQEDKGFFLLDRNTASFDLPYGSQWPGLVFYIGIFALSNTLFMWLYRPKSGFWRLMVLLYCIALVVAALLMGLNQSTLLPVYSAGAQTIKEFLLSPLPVFLMMPLAYWHKRNAAL